MFREWCAPRDLEICVCNAQHCCPAYSCRRIILSQFMTPEKMNLDIKTPSNFYRTSIPRCAKRAHRVFSPKTPSSFSHRAPPSHHGPPTHTGLRPTYQLTIAIHLHVIRVHESTSGCHESLPLNSPSPRQGPHGRTCLHLARVVHHSSTRHQTNPQTIIHENEAYTDRFLFQQANRTYK